MKKNTIIIKRTKKITNSGSGFNHKKSNNIKQFLNRICNIIFSKKFLYGTIIIFIIGFLGRYFILTYLGVNVVSDIYNYISITYYTLMSCLTRLVKELFSDSLTMNMSPDNNTGSTYPQQSVGGSANQAGTSNQGDAANQAGGAAANQADAANQPGSADLPQQQPVGGGGPAKGFMFDPVMGRYVIEDPTGISARGFNINLTSQPFATNLANALEHDWNVRKPTSQISGLSDNDSAFWYAFCKTQGQGKYDWNSSPKRLALRRLP